MAKSLETTKVIVTGMKEDGKSRRRTYNNVVSNAEPNKLWNFGVIIGQLTGETTDEVQVQEVSQISED